MQLKDIYTGTVKEKNIYAEENMRLKELLRQHGIPYPENGIASLLQYNDNAAAMQIDGRYGYQSDHGSSPNTMTSAVTSPTNFNTAPMISDYGQQSRRPRSAQQLMTGNRLEDQLSVDFVLASVPPEAEPSSPAASSSRSRP